MKTIVCVLLSVLSLCGYSAAPSLVYNPYTTNNTTVADARVVSVAGANFIAKTNGVADVRGNQKFTMQTTGGNYIWGNTSGELRLTNLVNLVWYEWNDPFRMGSITDSGSAHFSVSPSTGDVSADGVYSGNAAGLTNFPSSVMAGTNATSYSNTLYSAIIPTKPVYLMVPFLSLIPNALYLFTSSDGTNFGQVGSDPIVNSFGNYSSTTAGTARDARVFEWRGKKYMSFWNAFATGSNPIGVLMESDNWVTWKTNSFLPRCPTGKTTIGPAQWFQDPSDGRLYMVRVACDNLGGPGIGSNNVPYYSYLTNAADITSFSSPVLMGGTFTTNIIDPCFVYWDNKYWCFAKQECASACAYTALFVSSTSFTNGWSVVSTNDWAGWGNGMEGAQLINNLNGTWSLYQEFFSGGAYYVSTCPYSTFPTNGWSARKLCPVPFPVSDPAMYVITNAVDIAQIGAGAGSLSKAKNPQQAGQLPDIDTIYGINCYWGGTNYQASTWQNVQLVQTQRSGLYINFYTSTANNLQQFEFHGLDRTTGTRSDMGTISKSGWVGPVAATTISASGAVAANSTLTAASTLTASSTLVATIGEKIVSMSAAPTPAQIGANNGWLWVSNTFLYYSYTANGSTSNNAVKVGP